MDFNTHTCTALFTTGPRIGQECGKTALHLCDGQWYCNRHKKKEDPTMLCSYGPYGLPLSDIDAMAGDLPEETQNQKAKMMSLRGYINLRIGQPIFKGQETLPLVYMAWVSKFASFPDQLDRIAIAKELAATIEYLVSRPDVYTDLNIDSVAEVVLKSISYDRLRGIFVANMVRA